MPPIALPRRQFLGRSAAAVAAAAFALRGAGADDALATSPRLTAAVIGHTGRGDYGHDLDTAFNDLPGVTVVAVADPDPAGRAKAAARAKAARQYDDFRAMIEKEKPNLVSVAPRWTDQHHAMIAAALDAGAHVYTEKPFATTLAEADDLLARADARGRKIAVAHQMRLAPSVPHLKRKLDDGAIGDLLEVRAWGKQDDARAGGEDMMVLGVHLFDLLRFFAGDALWCTARVLQRGRDVTAADARAVKEAIGPVAGDEISAQFAFDRGVNGSFTSRARMRESTGAWGIELVGSKRSARLVPVGVYPAVYLSETGPWGDEGRSAQWRRMADDPGRGVGGEGRTAGPGNRRVVDDWLAAIREDREPVCSGRAATKALEMVMVVYHAALSGSRVPLPLRERGHPLKPSA